MKTTILLSTALFIAFGIAAAGNDDTEKNTRPIAVSLNAPNSTWAVKIEAIYRVEDKLWVISRVFHDPDAIGAMVISTIHDEVNIIATDLAVQHYIIGKTWGWTHPKTHIYLKNQDAIAEDLEKAEQLYRREKLEVE